MKIDKNKDTSLNIGSIKSFEVITRKRTAKIATNDVLNLIAQDRFYKEDICKREKYKEIKRKILFI